MIWASACREAEWRTHGCDCTTVCFGQRYYSQQHCLKEGQLSTEQQREEEERGEKGNKEEDKGGVGRKQEDEENEGEVGRIKKERGE